MSENSQSMRKQSDFTKLIIAGYELELNKGNTQDFYVIFHGPKETGYDGGTWKVHVTLPDEYPFASPSIGFCNKVLHPNIDEASGSVCLDVINQTWTPLYSLVNVFEIFLPQLLAYPNPSDPLNSDAAFLMMKDRNAYEQKVKEYVKLYAHSNTKLQMEDGELQNAASTKKTKYVKLIPSTVSTGAVSSRINLTSTFGCVEDDDNDDDMLD